MDANREQTTESTPNSMDARPRRVRTGRKRTAFKKAPRPAWPVRGLWESAPQKEKEHAHQTCIRILEYWLGKKSKALVARELAVSPLRVWQLSQQALSGMMAGLLKQPRTRVSPEVFEVSTGESRETLQRRVARLEKELSRTEDLVRVLRTAPWASASSESSPKGDPSHAKRARRKRTAKSNPKSNPEIRTTASRPDPARAAAPEGGDSCAG
jgi:hypothetical protein